MQQQGIRFIQKIPIETQSNYICSIVNTAQSTTLE